MSMTSKPSLLEEGTHNAIGRETWRLLPPAAGIAAAGRAPPLSALGGPAVHGGAGRGPPAAGLGLGAVSLPGLAGIGGGSVTWRGIPHCWGAGGERGAAP